MKLLLFLISSGIARVCAIELYKLVLNRKGSKICMLALNFPIAVECCPMFLNCGFQDYRVPNEAVVQVTVQICGSGRVNPPQLKYCIGVWIMAITAICKIKT